MFRFLGNCAESKCKQRLDTGPRASSQLSSILDGSHPCVASSSGWVRVGQSTVSGVIKSVLFSYQFSYSSLFTGGGDGLFAVRDIEPETFISFYHGELCGPGQSSDNPCTGRRPDMNVSFQTSKSIRNNPQV